MLAQNYLTRAEFEAAYLEQDASRFPAVWCPNKRPHYKALLLLPNCWMMFSFFLCSACLRITPNECICQVVDVCSEIVTRLLAPFTMSAIASTDSLPSCFPTKYR